MQYPIFLLIFLGAAVVGGVVALIVRLAGKGGKGAVLTAATIAAIAEDDSPSQEAATDTVARSSSSASTGSDTATIFINGGAPANGNVIGNLSVDGKSITLYYTDAPLEIAIATGRHHVVVEGGLYGDARIDRMMDFGSLDVWTVDMPGAGDEDLIRHQMIGYSEYRQALRECGFTVTRKRL